MAALSLHQDGFSSNLLLVWIKAWEVGESGIQFHISGTKWETVKTPPIPLRTHVDRRIYTLSGS